MFIVRTNSEHMTVTYIYHSCYLLEYESFSLLFDFYKDVQRDDGSYWIKDYLLSKPQDLYVFCTHSHDDHYNPEVLTWQSKKNNIQYIFSKELLDSGTVYNMHNIIFLDKTEKWEDHNLEVQAFGSTDIGGSFLLTVDGRRIFHAGDLNNWHWNEEVPPAEAASYENNFLCELELVTESLENLCLTMFPVDPRLGKDYMRGAEQFVKRISTNYFLPMHFGENYEQVNAFERYAKQQSCTYLKITHKGQTYKLKYYNNGN